MSTAYALDGVAIEFVFSTGPLLVAVFVAVLAPEWAIIAGCALAIGGVLAFVRLPISRAWQPAREAGTHGILGALRSPGIRTLVLTILPMGFCFGTMEVALPAFAEDEEGNRAFAGVLLSVWSLASAAGGIWYGGLTLRGTPGSRYARLALLLPLGFVPLALAPSVEVMIALMIPAGLCIAPLIIAANQLVGDVAPPGARHRGLHVADHLAGRRSRGRQRRRRPGGRGGRLACGLPRRGGGRDARRGPHDRPQGNAGAGVATARPGP